MNWFQKIFSTIRYDRNLRPDHLPEDRPNPNKPISFFEHDGQNLYRIDGISSDSHSSIGFPYIGDILASGRVSNSSCTMSLDPDNITHESLNRIVSDVIGEYGSVKIRAEYFGEIRNINDILQELAHQSHQ